MRARAAGRGRAAARHARRHPHHSPAGSASASASPGRSRSTRDLIVCDEPVSALDVSIQAQIVNLLQDLQRQFGLSYLFIAHDLAVVKHISDRVAVMYLGKLVEIAAKRDLYERPLHPYTQARCRRSPDRTRRFAEGACCSPATCRARWHPPSGCRFHAARSPRHAAAKRSRCREAGAGHRVACHFHETLPAPRSPPQPARPKGKFNNASPPSRQ